MSKFDLEFVHKDLYTTALSLSKKFVSKNSIRPTLTYTHHDEDGSIQATDSHQLLIVEDIHGFGQSYLIDPNHFTMAKGNYPDVSGVVPSLDKPSFDLNKEQIKLWYQSFKSINQMFVSMKERTKHVTMVFNDDSVEIVATEHKVVMKLPVNNYVKPDIGKVVFDVEYMRNNLEVHHRMLCESATFYFTGASKPIVLKGNTNVTTLLLPVRIH